MTFSLIHASCARQWWSIKKQELWPLQRRKTIFQEIKKNRIFNIEVSDKKKNNISVGKKNSILNAEVSDKKKQCRFFNTKRSADFEKKKQDKTFYTNSKSAGCRKKKCNVLKKRGQRNSTRVIQMKTLGVLGGGLIPPEGQSAHLLHAECAFGPLVTPEGVWCANPLLHWLWTLSVSSFNILWPDGVRIALCFAPPPPFHPHCSVGRWFECVSRGPIRPRPLRVAVCTPSCPDGRRMQPPLFAHRNIRSPAANAACDEVVQGGPMWWLCDRCMRL